MRAFLAGSGSLAAILSGEVAARHGGPWSPPGLAAVYASLDPGAAALELLIHLNAPPPALAGYRLWAIELPDAPVATHAGTRRPREVGRNFLLAARHLALRVPSRAVPWAQNLLINPRHPAFVGVRVVGESRLGPG